MKALRKRRLLKFVCIDCYVFREFMLLILKISFLTYNHYHAFLSENQYSTQSQYDKESL